MLAIQVMSDLHFDVNKSSFIPRVAANHLALLGDIGQPTSPVYQSFVRLVSKLYATVVIIFGNHEYYGHRDAFESLEAWFRDWLQQNKLCNVHFLQNETLDLEGVRVCGTTLWSDIKDKQRDTIVKRLRDYKETGATPDSTRHLHHESVRWLESVISTSDKPCLVLTHHCPVDSVESAGIYYGNDINSAFCSDLTHMMLDPVAAWCYGHVHINNQYQIGSVRLYSNQLGYTRERLDFDPCLVVQIKSSTEEQEDRHN